jgi:1,4-alpha-glucan branching enzyme
LFYHIREETKAMTIVRQDGSVEFRFFRPEARDVRVAGDFNGWSGESLHMKPAGNGWWTARTNLGSGEYRFRYVADGRWFTDYASNGVEFAKLGLNSLLIVPKQERATTPGNEQGGSAKREPQRRPRRDNAKSAVM